MSKEFLHKMFALDGQVAVVIGGSGCLGGLLSEGLARAGATIVVSGRNAGRGHRRVELIRALGGQAGFVPVDALSEDALRQFVTRVLDDHGNVDILVNAASAGQPKFDSAETAETGKTAETVKTADARQALDVRWATTQLACLVFAPRMARQQHGGVILNLGCSRAEPPGFEQLAQSAATSAIVDLTRNLAERYADQGVRVNALRLDLPGIDSGTITKDPRPIAERLVGPMLLAVSRSAGCRLSGAVLDVAAAPRTRLHRAAETP